MSIRDYLQNIFKNCKSTFRDTSLDTKNSKHLCTDKSSTPVYDFDKYIKDNNDYPLPASPDAIYLGKNKFYFVEFKNSPITNIKLHNIKNKFNSGTRVLKAILRDFLPQKKYKFIFCVVYRSPEVKYFDPISIESNIIRFGLNEENINNDKFYDKIFTNDVNFYKKEFSMLNC